MESSLLTQHTSGATSQFKFEFLRKITNDFSSDRIIGSGTYGVVYKGVMGNGEEIAVKKLKYMPPDHDSEKQFRNECINLMRVQHQNIVRLVGYCDETHRQCLKYDGEYVFADENERALCFEYLQGGSLDKHIYDEPCRLDWDTCYKIIKGVCEGLNHLHNGYRDSVFHLDLKPANILLDNNMIPKIGDFGLSRHFSTTGTCTTATPLGTTGYAPPEYVDKQEISPKYDVFSLGVVIIHLMAGRKHYYDHVDTPSRIIELVCENWKKRLPATMWSHASKEVKTCIEIALRCVKSSRQERPTISKIVDDLNCIGIAHEDTNLQSREVLDYNQYTNSGPKKAVMYKITPAICPNGQRPKQGSPRSPKTSIAQIDDLKFENSCRPSSSRVAWGRSLPAAHPPHSSSSRVAASTHQSRSAPGASDLRPPSSSSLAIGPQQQQHAGHHPVARRPHAPTQREHLQTQGTSRLRHRAPSGSAPPGSGHLQGTRLLAAHVASSSVSRRLPAAHLLPDPSSAMVLPDLNPTPPGEEDIIILEAQEGQNAAGASYGVDDQLGRKI